MSAVADNSLEVQVLPVESSADGAVLLAALRAAGDESRLRLLILCCRSELTVSELTWIVGMSQPRVSRHLKLLCDAGLLDRCRQGSWVFYRLALDGAGAEVAAFVGAFIQDSDPLIARDLERLEAVRRDREQAAQDYFRQNAENWEQVKALYVPEHDIEGTIRKMLHGANVADHLDIGTGTGRLLGVLSEVAQYAVGIDQSPEMLAVARNFLEREGLTNCRVQQADMTNLPFETASFDLVTAHQVLHYADDPVAAITEAARVLRPSGHILVADFLPHDIEELRDTHAHRRLGFADDELSTWFARSGLKLVRRECLSGNPLTVGIWLARKAGAEEDEHV